MKRTSLLRAYCMPDYWLLRGLAIVLFLATPVLPVVHGLMMPWRNGVFDPVGLVGALLLISFGVWLSLMIWGCARAARICAILDGETRQPPGGVPTPSPNRLPLAAWLSYLVVNVLLVGVLAIICNNQEMPASLAGYTYETVKHAGLMALPGLATVALVAVAWRRRIRQARGKLEDRKNASRRTA
jgi:hypothetical protein